MQIMPASGNLDEAPDGLADAHHVPDVDLGGFLLRAAQERDADLAAAEARHVAEERARADGEFGSDYPSAERLPAECLNPSPRSVAIGREMVKRAKPTDGKKGWWMRSPIGTGFWIPDEPPKLQDLWTASLFAKARERADAKERNVSIRRSNERKIRTYTNARRDGSPAQLIFETRGSDYDSYSATYWREFSVWSVGGEPVVYVLQNAYLLGWQDPDSAFETAAVKWLKDRLG